MITYLLARSRNPLFNTGNEAALANVELSLAGAATNIIFVATNACCRDKSMLAATKLLSRPIYVCHEKTFVATNTCFVATNTCFVATKLFF